MTEDQGQVQSGTFLCYLHFPEAFFQVVRLQEHQKVQVHCNLDRMQFYQKTCNYFDELVAVYIVRCKLELQHLVSGCEQLHLHWDLLHRLEYENKRQFLAVELQLFLDLRFHK